MVKIDACDINQNKNIKFWSVKIFNIIYNSLFKVTFVMVEWTKKSTFSSLYSNLFLINYRRGINKILQTESTSTKITIKRPNIGGPILYFPRTVWAHAFPEYETKRITEGGWTTELLLQTQWS